MDQTAGKSSQENPAQKDLAAPQPYSGLSTGSLSCARYVDLVWEGVHTGFRAFPEVGWRPLGTGEGDSGEL